MKNKGRPPRHQDELLGRNRTFRITVSLDDMLIAAAKVSGRSVSSEIEHRLQQTLDPKYSEQQMQHVVTIASTVASTVAVNTAKSLLDPAAARPAPEIPDKDRE